MQKMMTKEDIIHCVDNKEIKARADIVNKLTIMFIEQLEFRAKELEETSRSATFILEIDIALDEVFRYAKKNTEIFVLNLDIDETYLRCEESEK